MLKLHTTLLILITTLLTTQLMACQNKNKSENKMNIEQPNYYIKLQMLGCKRIVAVNGFEVESDFKGYSSTAEIPINHLIKNGENHFELMLQSRKRIEKKWTDNSECGVEIRVSGTVENIEVDYKVADIVFNPDYSEPSSNLIKSSMVSGTYSFDNQKTILKEGGSDSTLSEISIIPGYEKGMDSVFQRSFTANVPFPRWAFFDGEQLFGGFHPVKNDEAYDSAEDIIWPKVEELWDLFENKKLDKILPLFEFRSKEYDQAFYREPGNTLMQLENSLNNVYANKYPLNRKDRQKMQMLVSYADNLVTIVNAGSGNGTVMFYDQESNSNTFYNVYWMQKDGEWIIAR